VVRPVTTDDRAPLLALFAAANWDSDGRYAPGVTRGTESIAAWFDRKTLDQSWVLAGPRGLVGHVGVRRDPEPARKWGLPVGPSTPAWVEVARLAVHPNWQRRGQARRLMAHVHHELAGQWCWLTCHRGSPGHRLHLQLGWRPTDLPIRWEGDPTPGVLLTRTPS
jgi:GNAT superfamily N-acetyltransferase